MTSAVSASGMALQYASERLRGDLGVVMVAVSADGSAPDFRQAQKVVSVPIGSFPMGLGPKNSASLGILAFWKVFF